VRACRAAAGDRGGDVVVGFPGRRAAGRTFAKRHLQLEFDFERCEASSGTWLGIQRRPYKTCARYRGNRPAMPRTYDEAVAAYDEFWGGTTTTCARSA